MKKLITVLLIGLMIISFSGCGEVEVYKDELISVKQNSNKNESGIFFVVWASYTKNEYLVYNFYHKSKDGKIQLSIADVYDVEIYEDVPKGEAEYVAYNKGARIGGGEILYPKFHVHKGSIQPIVELDVNK